MVDDRIIVVRESRWSWLTPLVLFVTPVVLVLGYGLTGFIFLALVIGLRNAGWFVTNFAGTSMLALIPVVIACMVGYGLRRLFRVRRWRWQDGGQFLAKVISVMTTAILINQLGSWFRWDWAIWLTGGPLYVALQWMWVLGAAIGISGGLAVRTEQQV